MNELNFLQNSANNNLIFCPNNNCLNVPNIKYNYNPLNSNIQYICNYNNANNEIINVNLSEFLEKSSNIKCSECQLNIIDNDLYYCKGCKKIYDYSCFEEHLELTNHNVFSINKNNIANNCLQHGNRFIFYCSECNKSLCSDCDLNYHNNQRHNLTQIINSLCNKNYMEKTELIFKKQKKLLERIKKMNEKFIRSLEDDILMKQRIIESNINNKYNYQSISNFNNLNLENDSKFEKLLEKIIEKEDEIEKNNNGTLDNEVFVNRVISTFYYSLMINKDKKLNDILIKTLEKLLSNINENIGNNKEKIVNVNNNSKNNNIKIINNNIDYIYDKKDGGSNEDEIKVNNYINIENNRNNNNNNFNISVDCSKRYYHIANSNNQNQNKNLFNKKINLSKDAINGNNNNKLILEDYMKQNNKVIDFYRNNINNNKKINFFDDEKSTGSHKKINFYVEDKSKTSNKKENNISCNDKSSTIKLNNSSNLFNVSLVENKSSNNSNHNTDIIFSNSNSNINTLSNIKPQILNTANHNISLSDSKTSINNNLNSTNNLNLNDSNSTNNNGLKFNLRNSKKNILENKDIRQKEENEKDRK